MSFDEKWCKKFLVHFLAIYSSLHLIIGRDRTFSFPDIRTIGYLKPDIRYPDGYFAIHSVSGQIIILQYPALAEITGTKIAQRPDIRWPNIRSI